MSNLESKFNSATDFLGVASLGGVILSGILLFTPVKAMGYIGIGGGLGTFAASVVSRKKHLRVAEQYVSQMYKDYDGELTDKESQIYQLTDTVQDLKGTIHNLQNETARFQELAEKIESLTRQNESKDNIIEQVTNELERLISLARTAVEESLDEWETKLSSLVDTKKDQYPKLAERLNALLDEGQGKLKDYGLKLAQTPSKWDSLGDLLSLYYCLNDDLANIKTRVIQAIAKLTNQQTQHELQEVEEILEEWQTANLVPRDKLEHIIRNYEAALNEFRADFSTRFDATHQFALALEGQTQEDDKFVQTILARMQELEQKIHQLSKPLRYLNATRSDMVIANIIIGYFERLGFTLDRAGTDYRGHEATLEFITDRTGRLVLASELNEHVERLQPLTHVLNTLEFKLDPETGLMTLLVRWGNKPAANTSEQALRLISPLADVVTRLIEGLSHKPTIRIMGATGEGKGVMARYLLSQILTSNPWYCRLHDPQHGSSEDYWGIPKVSRSGNELKKALKDIESQMISREATKNWDVVTLDILDEIDTHLDRKEKKESFIDLVSRIRHLGMKLILIGQNPKVGRAGFEWSDMQQMNCIYMGASALDAIEANPQLKPRKDKLTKEYITLSEHYERENDGLDDGEKYLFGLVVIPGKTPIWVELPRPDSIKVECDEFLLGIAFAVPNSFNELIEGQKSAKSSGDSAITNSISDPGAKPETLVNEGMPAFAVTSDYVGVGGTAGTSGKTGKATCKKHPDAELRTQKDGRLYCPSCKKRLAKSDVEYC
jgi:cell division septum initiation protein DivIVA